MSILRLPSALKPPESWRTVKLGERSDDQSTVLRIDLLVAAAEYTHMHPAQIGRIPAHVSPDLAFGDRERHGPGRIEMTAVMKAVSVGDGLSILPTMTRVAPLDLVVADSLDECRRNITTT